MTYIAKFQWFHIAYSHVVEADSLEEARLLALEDLESQHRHHHPDIQLVEVTPSEGV